MKRLLNEPTFVSALKRKDTLHILAFLFEGTEVGEIAESTTRLTDAAIKRMAEAEAKLHDAEDTVIEDVEETAKEMNDLNELIEAVESAIEKGKKKKAKKALKALKESGLSGSEIDALTKKVKDL